MNSNINNTKPSIAGLLPIGIFLLIYLGTGIVFNDFYSMPAIVAFLIALAVAFVQNRKVTFNEKKDKALEEIYPQVSFIK